MMLIDRCRRRLTGIVAGLRQAVVARLWVRPTTTTRATGTGADLLRSGGPLLAENALLHQQRLVLRRSVCRPVITRADRALLVLRAGRVRAWRPALRIVRPDTVLRWQRAGFRSFWTWRSRPGPGRPPLPAETVALIRRMAAENPLWGAERIRGERLKPDVRVSERTIRRYLRQVPRSRPTGQRGATCPRNHARDSWACDSLRVSDRSFRPLFACFAIALGARRVVHVGVTRRPTDARVAQQLREAPPCGERPRFRIRDNDGTYGSRSDRVAAASEIRVRRRPVRAPRANATCERFLGGARRECLDHLLILTERQLGRVLREYATYVNAAWPRRPHPRAAPAAPDRGGVVAAPVLGGRHHDDQRAA